MISIEVANVELRFEHSLVSLSEWEAEYEKLFFSEKEEKSEDEIMRYFEMMVVSPKKKSHLVYALSDEQKIELFEYIRKSRTATTVKEIQSKTGKTEAVSSELIYYWFVAFRIPFRPTETWHLNRALTLVRVCSIKNAPPKKHNRTTRAQAAQDMRALNERRREMMGTKG